MTNTLHLKKKTLWDLKKIDGLPIYGQVYDEYTPWNEDPVRDSGALISYIYFLLPHKKNQ